MSIFGSTYFDDDKKIMSTNFKNANDYYTNNECKYPSMDWNSLNGILDTCRNRQKGKPISSWGRLKEDDNGDIYLALSYYGESEYRAWSVSKNNIVTFHQESSRTGGQTLVSSMPRFFPVSFHRQGTRDYRVYFGWDLYTHKKQLAIHKINVEGRDTDNWDLEAHMGKSFYGKAPYVYKGLQYDLNTNEFINAKPMSKSEEYPEKRKEWRAMLTNHKRVLKSMISIGMLDKLMSEIDDEKMSELTKVFNWYGIPWNRKDIVKYVTTCMAKDDIPEELLGMYAFHFAVSHNWRRRAVNPNTVDGFFQDYGFAFKQYLGVFKTLGYKHSSPTRVHLNSDIREKDHTLDEILNLFKTKEKDNE
jgi:hypothetical protein